MKAAAAIVFSAILTTLVLASVAAQSGRPRKDIPSIAKAANGAIVSIVMSDKDGHTIAKGTGFLTSKDGRIVTNYHVIENGSSASVKLPDGTFFVVDGVLASDKARDVAVIKAHGENFHTLALGNSDQVQVGEEVVAIGNPLSLESTVSNGIVSGIRTDEERGGKFLQVTTPISPGSSGGPLFNMMGEVVGITTMYLEGGENLNFAIPINDAKRLLLAKTSTIRPLPNEPEPIEAQTHDGDHPQARNQPALGVYQSEANGSDDGYWEYLRIYADGTVIGVTANATPDKIVNWFRKPWRQTGLYQVQGSTILFSIASPAGTVDYQGQILGTGTVLSLDSFSHINAHRAHTTYHLVLPGGGDAPPSVSAVATKTNSIARDYYQQLFDAGGFSTHFGRAYVCFSDDANSGRFFTFFAVAYDENYSKAEKKSVEILESGGDTTTANPEIEKIFEIEHRIQGTGPYVTFLPEDFLSDYSPDQRQFLRDGGRVLIETDYEKGIKGGGMLYLWDGSKWVQRMQPQHPEADVQVSKIFYLSIEPSTMRYSQSGDITVTAGRGKTAVTRKDKFDPWDGVCEEVPKPKVK